MPSTWTSPATFAAFANNTALDIKCSPADDKVSYLTTTARVRIIDLSLRMNLYGWSLSAFKQVLGRKDSAVLEKATALISESLPEEPDQSKAKAWLHTLIMSGFPFRQEREQPSAPGDGGLLTVQMETESHVAAVYCLARAIARDEHLDLAGESSTWANPAVGSLFRELSSCGFTKSKSGWVQYLSWMSGLGNGTPLFGDDFRTQWSFYTLFSNSDLATMIPFFQEAVDFRRTLPEDIPEQFTQKIPTSLSDNGKDFALDLIRWFGQIHEAGQDAFILWW